MVRSLRNRLILSQVVPLLVIVPLMGLALIYILETQVVLVNLGRQLRGQAVLVAELTRDESGIWEDRRVAQAFVERINPLFQAELTLLDARGARWAGRELGDADVPLPELELAAIADLPAGEANIDIAYTPLLTQEVINVVTPVRGQDGQLHGFVRLNNRFGQLYERVSRLRSLILLVLCAGLASGIGIGVALAINLERPIRGVTVAIYQLARGHRLSLLDEAGPEETRLLARAFNLLVERLQELEEARRHLLANLVHEIGRPLGAINAATQALLGQAGSRDEVRQELLLGVKDEVQRLRGLMEELTALHEVVLGVRELRCEPTELSRWLATMLPTWREAARQKGLEWQEALPGTLPTIEIDRGRLGQVVGNLLSNAIKYTPPGGEVRVSAAAEEESIWIRVSDSGPGIPLDEQALIFDPFFRGTGRRFPQGLGLGLTIARDIASAHGGRLEVQSAPGTGSHFTLWLPCGPVVEQGRSDHAPSSSSSR